MWNNTLNEKAELKVVRYQYSQYLICSPNGNRTQNHHVNSRTLVPCDTTIYIGPEIMLTRIQTHIHKYKYTEPATVVSDYHYFHRIPLDCIQTGWYNTV